MLTTAILRNRFLAGMKGIVSDRTHISYRTRLNMMIRSVPDDPTRVKPKHILEWLATAQSPVTHNSYLSTARVFWQWCVDHDHVDRSPCRGVRPARVPRRAPRALSRAEADALWHHLATQCPPSYLRAGTLMLQEGLRIGEIRNARWEDYDPTRGQLAVRGKGGRGEITRVVPLSEQSLEVLNANSRLRGPVMADPQGRHWDLDTLSNMFAAVIRDAIGGQIGDGRTAHALRHTAATDMVNGGANMRDVQAILGHATIATTERYTSGAVNHLHDAIAGRWYGTTVM